MPAVRLLLSWLNLTQWQYTVLLDTVLAVDAAKLAKPCYCSHSQNTDLLVYPWTLHPAQESFTHMLQNKTKKIGGWFSCVSVSKTAQFTCARKLPFILYSPQLSHETVGVKRVLFTLYTVFHAQVNGAWLSDHLTLKLSERWEGVATAMLLFHCNNLLPCQDRMQICYE